MTQDRLSALKIRAISEEDQARIDRMKAAPWIGYERALHVRQQMDDLLRHPRMHRMPNMSLIGETNNGKTMLLKNFVKRHNPPEDPNAEKTTLPVLMVPTPPAPDEGRLYFTLLDRLAIAGSAREPEESKLRRLRIILTQLETRMLILDDFFNVGAGTPAQRKKFLNALRNLSNELEIPFIVAGTPETLNALSTDPSIVNRFRPEFLPKWSMERAEEFARFVLSVETTLGLKYPCQLMTEDALAALCVFGEGLLGEIVAILKLLAESAIRTGTETIDKSHLKKQNLTALGWVMPSDRARHFK